LDKESEETLYVLSETVLNRNEIDVLHNEKGVLDYLKTKNVENINFIEDFESYSYELIFEAMDENNVKIEGTIRGFDKVFTENFNINRSELINIDDQKIEELERYRMVLVTHFINLEKKILNFFIHFSKKRDETEKTKYYNELQLFNNESVENSHIDFYLAQNHEYIKQQEMNEKVIFPKSSF
jgi:hypothetical protein